MRDLLCIKDMLLKVSVCVKNIRLMGISQSTRYIPDYVYVVMKPDDKGYVSVTLIVYNTENALRLRLLMREQEDRSELPPCDYWPSDSLV